MTIVPANVEPGKERCEGCIHFDDLGRIDGIGNINIPSKNCFGECICHDSDHYGHVISFGHLACRQRQV